MEKIRHQLIAFAIFIVLFCMMFAFLSVFYAKEALNNEIHRNFTTAVDSIQDAAIQMQMLSLLCNHPPINVNLAEGLKDKISGPYSRLVTAQAQLGKLISPATSCELSQFAGSLNKTLLTLSFSANFCSVIPSVPASREQARQLTNKLISEEQRISVNKEYFAKKRYEQYPSTVCPSTNSNN